MGGLAPGKRKWFCRLFSRLPKQTVSEVDGLPKRLQILQGLAEENGNYPS
jgi:hypothetical protein